MKWNKLQSLELSCGISHLGIEIDSVYFTLQWCHNERNGVLNHWRLGCLLNRLFGRRSKKTYPRHCLFEGNSLGTSELPTPRASNAENASIGWRRHAPAACCSANFKSKCRTRSNIPVRILRDICLLIHYPISREHTSLDWTFSFSPLLGYQHNSMCPDLKSVIGPINSIIHPRESFTMSACVWHHYK